MGLKHAYKSLKTDPTDPTIIGATKWNDDHYYVDGAGAPVGNVGAVLLAGAAGALTHLNSVAAGSVLTSAGVGALPVWAPAAGGVPAALVADSLTLSIANPDVVLSRSAATRLLLGGVSLLQFGGTTNAFPALRRTSNELYVMTADDASFANLYTGNVWAMGSLGFLSGGSNRLYLRWGAGSPEGVQDGNVGCLYLRTDGGPTTTLYVKTSGTATVTGWTAK